MRSNGKEEKKEKSEKMSSYDTYIQIGNPNEDTEYTGRYWSELSSIEQEEYQSTCVDTDLTPEEYQKAYDSVEEQLERMADAAWEAVNDSQYPID